MGNSSNRSTATYLYGIVRGLSAEPPSLPAVGDADAEIRSIEAASGVAIVSDVADAFVEATAEDLQRHSDVLQALLASTDALVPLRFGTVYPDEQTILRELLDGRADELDALVQGIENRVEARLKAFYIEGAILGEIVAQQPQVAELRRRTQTLPADATFYDRIRLGELVASALSARRRRDGERILSRLAPLAVDYSVEEESHEWSVLTASFLVERSAVDAFQSAVAALAEADEQRLQMRCLAPLPPYSFVSLSREPIDAEAAWVS